MKVVMDRVADAFVYTRVQQSEILIVTDIHVSSQWNPRQLSQVLYVI